MKIGNKIKQPTNTYRFKLEFWDENSLFFFEKYWVFEEHVNLDKLVCLLECCTTLDNPAEATDFESFTLPWPRLSDGLAKLESYTITWFNENGEEFEVILAEFPRF